MPIELEAVRRVFRAEAQEQLAAIEQALLALEAAPDDAEALRQGFHALHTLKGSALTVDLPALAHLAHGMEDLLEQLREGRLQLGRMLMSLLLECVDALREASETGAEPGEAEAAELARLAQRIDAVRGRSGGAPPAAPEAGAPAPRAAAATEPRAPEPRPAAPLRVDARKLDVLFELTGELAHAQSAFQELLDELPGPAGEKLAAAFREPARLRAELQRQLQQLRRVPLGPLLQQFVRVARDLAHALEKRVRVEVRSGDVELDAAVAAQLRAPLTHLVRNALAHGIELPTERERRGKTPWGSLSLRAAYRGGGVVIECTDDGRGLDRERIVACARQRGLLPDAAALSEAEIDALLFEEGLSTAESVTELAGRGVGLGVVRSDIEALGGAVRLSGVPGAGTTVTISLPDRPPR